MSLRFDIQGSGFQRGALATGIVGAVLGAIGAAVRPADFFQSYLFAYQFWLGVSLGAAVIVMIHHLSGGAWGFLIRRPLEAAFRQLPVMLVLFLPFFFALPELYVWARPEAVAASVDLQSKSWYLNASAFALRSLIYLGLWLGLTQWLSHRSKLQDRRADPGLTAGLQRLSGGGLVLHTLLLLFAGTDWIMSIEPRWISTAFPLLWGTGQVLAALCLGIVCAALLVRDQPLAAVSSPDRFNDLGNLLLAFVLMWTYLAYMQYLIIWSENLPRETIWYLPRVQTSWRWLGIFLVVFHFAIPLLVLLLRRAKRVSARLGAVACALFVVHIADVFWLTVPLFRPEGLRVTWLDVVAFAGVGGLWLAGFARALRSRPLLPAFAPGITEVLEHG